MWLLSNPWTIGSERFLYILQYLSTNKEQILALLYQMISCIKVIFFINLTEFLWKLQRRKGVLSSATLVRRNNHWSIGFLLPDQCCSSGRITLCFCFFITFKTNAQSIQKKQIFICLSDLIDYSINDKYSL
jgi:hypothetical protein